MKGGILLILVLLLLCDLAEDSWLVKVKFVDSQSSAETSLSSPLMDCSEKVSSRDALPSQAGKIPCLLQFQELISLIKPALNIIINTHTGSSGGIPL
jgi:hypothetical protein